MSSDVASRTYLNSDVVSVLSSFSRGPDDTEGRRLTNSSDGKTKNQMATEV
jgi:hypothetical protein